MRTLVLISLLSVIGVIKCRPQRELGQSIPVEAQLRYNSQSIHRKLFNFGNVPLPLNTNSRTTLPSKAVRKNNPFRASISKTLPYKQSSAYLGDNPVDRKSVRVIESLENSKGIQKSLPFSQSLAHLKDIQIDRKPATTIQNTIPFFLSPTNFENSNLEGRRSLDYTRKTNVDLVRTIRNENNLSSTIPKPLEREPFFNKKNHHGFSDLILPSSFPFFGNDLGRKRRNNSLVSSPEYSTKYIQNKTNSFLQIEPLSLPHSRPVAAISSKAGGLPKIDQIVGSTTDKNTPKPLNKPVERPHSTSKNVDLSPVPTSWYSTRTLYYHKNPVTYQYPLNESPRNRSSNWYQPGLHSRSQNYEINAPNPFNITKNVVPHLKNNEDAKKLVHKIPNVFQSKIGLIQTNYEILPKNIGSSVNVVKGIKVESYEGEENDSRFIHSLEGSKSNTKFIRKAPIRTTPVKRKVDQSHDVLNLNLNITKISQTDYKITTKDNVPSSTKVYSNLNRLNLKNSTKINNVPKNSTKTNVGTRPNHPFFSQETIKPLTDNQNSWFQLKLKRPGVEAGTEKNYDYSSIPSIYLTNYLSPTNYGSSYGPNEDIISSSLATGSPNDYTSSGSFIVSNYLSTTPSPNGYSSYHGVNIGNTITLSPEVVSISQGSHTLAGPEVPCTNFHIENNLYNKESCQDVEITINNHVHTENNYYEEDVQEPPYIESPNDYSEGDYEESVEVTENAIITNEDEYEDELAQEAVVAEAEPILQEALPAEASIAESSPISPGGTNSGGSSNSGLPNRPNLPRPGSSGDDDDDGGIFGGLFSGFGAFNLFNFPLIGLLAAPLTILLTSALGVTTFFLPWTILPTLFLGRKAKQSSEFDAGNRPDMFRPEGWFWHNTYKTWVNMKADESARGYDDVGNFVIKLIEEFGRRYSTSYNESWKRRKKNS